MNSFVEFVILPRDQVTFPFPSVFDILHVALEFEASELILCAESKISTLTLDNVIVVINLLRANLLRGINETFRGSSMIFLIKLNKYVLYFLWKNLFHIIYLFFFFSIPWINNFGFKEWMIINSHNMTMAGYIVYGCRNKSSIKKLDFLRV